MSLATRAPEVESTREETAPNGNGPVMPTASRELELEIAYGETAPNEPPELTALGQEQGWPGEGSVVEP